MSQKSAAAGGAAPSLDDMGQLLDKPEFVDQMASMLQSMDADALGKMSQQVCMPCRKSFLFLNFFHTRQAGGILLTYSFLF